MSENAIDNIRRAIEKIQNAPIEICGATYPHVVHPEAVGWTGCANCFSPVFIDRPGEGSEHD